MRLEHKIGQLFLLGFQGDKIDNSHPIATDIRERHLGGVILFDRCLATGKNQNNIVSPAQVKTLTSTLQGMTETPLLIGIDQEGGRVRRLKAETGFPATASAAELGQKNDTTQTALHALVTADTLHHLGINLNFAPVLDLNSFPDNPVIGGLDRSFSASPEAVTLHAREWIKAHKNRSILNCCKHFPGHGSSRTDSHLGFTDISESWRDEELQPYQTLIREGWVDSIMVGHLVHRHFDERHPASCSSAIIQNLLRDQMRFQGAVITDDLQMKAITDQYGMEEAVCLALAAGADLLIIGNNLEYVPDVLNKMIMAVQKAIDNGKLSIEQIHTAFNRVQQLKEKTGHACQNHDRHGRSQHTVP